MTFNGGISRRDFLKLTSIIPLSLAVPKIDKYIPKNSQGNKNIIIVVFDALSARHISYLGYSRETTPNLARLADKAIVYHNHYSAGNYTTPGTASLFTGVLPWKHRALGYDEVVADNFLHKTIFGEFQDYLRIVYTHNLAVNTMFKHFNSDLDDYTPREDLVLQEKNVIDAIFSSDSDIAEIGRVRGIGLKESGFSYSLFLSGIYDYFLALQNRKFDRLTDEYPLGLPYIRRDEFYLLNQAVDHAANKLLGAPQAPVLGYFHFLPPHWPYLPHEDFYGRFNDGQEFPVKEESLFTEGESILNQAEYRARYDEFLLQADAEFGKFYDTLEKGGLLENSILIFTSDHGELFERGIVGHTTPVLYEPVTRIPLLIFDSDQKTRIDIQEKTSAIDILPTLMKLSNREVPEWVDGIVLPPYTNGVDHSERDIFVVEARNTAKGKPITSGTVSLARGKYKLIYYFGYERLLPEQELVELFDLADDPQEVNNLADIETEIRAELLQTIKSKLTAANQPYL
jgi:arylsulfatase A-like enzyme